MVNRVIHGVDLTLEYLAKCRIISKTGDGKWAIKKMPSPLAASEEIHLGMLNQLNYIDF